MIDLILEIFGNIGHMWHYSHGWFKPNEKDVEQMLDNAAKALYDGSIGDRFEAGTTGLIIEKAEHGHDVYVYVGNYQ